MAKIRKRRRKRRISRKRKKTSTLKNKSKKSIMNLSLILKKINIIKKNMSNNQSISMMIKCTTRELMKLMKL